MMQALRQMGGGLLFGLVSVVLVVGGLSLALAESYTVSRPTPTSGLPPAPQTSTATPSGPTGFPTLTPPPTQTPPPPVNCAPPAGWTLIPVQPGDTLAGLAARYGTTPEQLAQANCLLSQSLVPGYGLYVPASQVNPIPNCGPYPGWIFAYFVQPGDTLFHIATLYGTSVDTLKFANCRPDNKILIGERLWVPNVPTITPGVTFIPDFGTPTEVPTEPLTSTPLPFTATVIPTNTNLPPTSTSVPPTITAFPTATP
jgi:LysM repeat protein